MQTDYAKFLCKLIGLGDGFVKHCASVSSEMIISKVYIGKKKIHNRSHNDDRNPYTCELISNTVMIDSRTNGYLS